MNFCAEAGTARLPLNQYPAERTFFLYELFVGAVIRSNGGSRQGDSCEEAPGTGIRKKSARKGHVGLGFRVAGPLDKSSGGIVISDFPFERRTAFAPRPFIDEQYEVRCLSADLQPAATFHGHHGWGGSTGL